MEEEKERALGLQRKEKELREKLLSNLIYKRTEVTHLTKMETNAPQTVPLETPKRVFHCITSTSEQSISSRPVQLCQNSITVKESMLFQPKYLNGNLEEEIHVKETKTNFSKKVMVSGENSSGILSCIPANQQHKSAPDQEQKAYKKELLSEQGKCNREPSKGKSHSHRDTHNHHSKDKTEKNRHGRGLSSDDEKCRKERHSHKKHSTKSSSPRRRSLSREHSQRRQSYSSDREQDKRGHSHGHKSASKKQKQRKRSLSNQRSTWSR